MDYLLPLIDSTSMLRIGLALLGMLLGAPGPATLASACAGVALAAPAPITSTQTFSDTFQPTANLFVCRVDGVGALASGSSTGTRSVTPTGLVLLVLARWLHFIGYALGFGTISFYLWIAAGLGDQSALKQHLWRLVNAGIALLVCAEPLALLAQTIGVRGELFDLAVAGNVLASGFGLVWAQRIAMALLLWVIVGVTNDGNPRALAAAPGLGLLLAAIDGVAGAAGASLVALSITATILHEAAMGVWVGSLALLLAIWSRLDRDRQAIILARFGLVSSAAVGVLLVSGLALSTLHLAQPAELFMSFYGATLMAKLLVGLIAIGLAFGARFFRQIWRWRAALAALIVVLGVAGLLVSVPSP